jgi:UPF0755 protein
MDQQIKQVEQLLILKQEKGKNRSRKIIFVVLVGIGSIVVLSLVILFLPPKQFPVGTIISVEKGTGLNQLADDFKGKHIVNSSLLFKYLVKFLGGEHSTESGDYSFDQRLGVYQVAIRMVKNNHGNAVLKVTIPEGLNALQISDILKSKFPRFDSDLFYKSSLIKEGYLFPDTYLFDASITSSKIIARMEENFGLKTKNIRISNQKGKHSFEDVVIMASILEREVKTQESRSIVAGILWKRLQMGIPLQVDATLGYVTGRGSSMLTVEDLHLASPYNTYQNKGLPPTPISNPGLDAIREAMNPKTTPYFFYLSDKRGVIHYAVTFEEHKANKAKYL